MLQWRKRGAEETSKYEQTEDGKTELSLMHFAVSFASHLRFRFSNRLAACAVGIRVAEPQGVNVVRGDAWFMSVMWVSVLHGQLCAKSHRVANNKLGS